MDSKNTFRDVKFFDLCPKCNSLDIHIDGTGKGVLFCTCMANVMERTALNSWEDLQIAVIPWNRLLKENAQRRTV